MSSSAIIESPPLLAPAVAPRGVPVPRSAWLGLAVIVLVSVMDLLDSTIAQTAAPVIRADLGGSFASLEWISAAYTLAMAVALLPAARLGDVLGRRRVLLLGLGGFVVTSTLCALAPSAGLLIAGRVLQGVSAAVMVPQTFGLIRDLFGAENQAKAFAVTGPVMGLAAIAGPLTGGGIVDLDVLSTGWRAIFLVNVPLGLVAIVAGRKLLPAVAPSDRDARFDLPSLLLATSGVTALVYPLIEGREQGWPLWSFAMLAGGVVLLAGLAVLQPRRVRAGKAPLVDPAILGRRAYVAGLGCVLGFIGAMGGTMLALNVMFQSGLGFSPLASGVATAAIPVAAIGGSITSSMLLERIGRSTMHIGLATMAGGLVITDVVLRSQGGGLSAWDVALPLVVTGFGMGMVFVPMFDVILAGVLPHQLGSASGLLESVQQLAMSLGIALVGTVLFDAAGRGGPDAFVRAADHALLVAVGLLVAAFAVVFALPRHTRGGH